MSTVFEFGAPPIDPRCGFLPCTEVAVWQITVKAPQPGDKVLEIYLGQGACNKHQTLLTSNKVLDGQMWEFIASLLKNHGYEVPPREAVRLLFESLDGTEQRIESYA